MKRRNFKFGKIIIKIDGAVGAVMQGGGVCASLRAMNIINSKNK